MQNRLMLTVGAAVLLAAGAGCSSPPAATPQRPGSLPPNTAHITVDGKDAGPVDNLNCAQTSNLYMIQAGDKDAGVSATMRFGDKITAQSVDIRNLAGFTGSYWQGTVGNGDAGLVGNTYKITGTAVGSDTDKPNAQVSVPFEIRANC